MSHFDTALEKTMANEGHGKLTDNPADPGGQTFSGISRRYWPSWAGWGIIDTVDRPFTSDIMHVLMGMAKDFYRVNFWDRLQGDLLSGISPAIAEEIFDTAVNVGVSRAVEILQEGFNVARGEYGADLLVDGELGPDTIQSLKNYMASQPGSPAINEEILLNCMNGEQYVFYKANPRHKYFRGWFRRV